MRLFFYIILLTFQFYILIGQNFSALGSSDPVENDRGIVVLPEDFESKINIFMQFMDFHPMLGQPEGNVLLDSDAVYVREEGSALLVRYGLELEGPIPFGELIKLDGGYMINGKSSCDQIYSLILISEKEDDKIIITHLYELLNSKTTDDDLFETTLNYIYEFIEKVYASENSNQRRILEHNEWLKTCNPQKKVYQSCTKRVFKRLWIGFKNKVEGLRTLSCKLLIKANSSTGWRSFFGCLGSIVKNLVKKSVDLTLAVPGVAGPAGLVSEGFKNAVEYAQNVGEVDDFLTPMAYKQFEKGRMRYRDIYKKNSKNIFKAIWPHMKNNIKGKISKVKKTLGRIKKKVFKKRKFTLKSLVKSGQRLITGFKNGVGKMIRMAKKFYNGLAQAANEFKDLPTEVKTKFFCTAITDMASDLVLAIFEPETIPSTLFNLYEKVNDFRSVLRSYGEIKRNYKGNFDPKNNYIHQSMLSSWIEKVADGSINEEILPRLKKHVKDGQYNLGMDIIKCLGSSFSFRNRIGVFSLTGQVSGAAHRLKHSAMKKIDNKGKGGIFQTGARFYNEKIKEGDQSCQSYERYLVGQGTPHPKLLVDIAVDRFQKRYEEKTIRTFVGKTDQETARKTKTFYHLTHYVPLAGMN